MINSLLNNSKHIFVSPSAAATCSWKKIKVTLPRCEADELTPATLAAERANPLASHEVRGEE